MTFKIAPWDKDGRPENLTYKSQGSVEFKMVNHLYWQGVPWLGLSISHFNGLQIQIVNYAYVRLLNRLPLGLTDSAAAPSAKSWPYMLLPLLFLLNVRLELSSTEANVSSSSNNIAGQLSFKCTKASDCITAAQGVIIYITQCSKLQISRGSKSH